MRVRFSIKRHDLNELEKMLKEKEISTEFEPLGKKYLHAKAPNYSAKLYPRSADVSERLYEASTPLDEELMKIVGKLYPLSVFAISSFLVGFAALAYIFYLAIKAAAVHYTAQIFNILLTFVLAWTLFGGVSFRHHSKELWQREPINRKS
ncbi:MAG: hypothetical protein ACE5Z5_06735 [Candidatus Bathyarchaeia archaeon]